MKMILHISVNSSLYSLPLCADCLVLKPLFYVRCLAFVYSVIALEYNDALTLYLLLCFTLYIYAHSFLRYLLHHYSVVLATNGVLIKKSVHW